MRFGLLTLAALAIGHADGLRTITQEQHDKLCYNAMHMFAPSPRIDPDVPFEVSFALRDETLRHFDNFELAVLTEQDGQMLPLREWTPPSGDEELDLTEFPVKKKFSVQLGYLPPGEHVVLMRLHVPLEAVLKLDRVYDLGIGYTREELLAAAPADVAWEDLVRDPVLMCQRMAPIDVQPLGETALHNRLNMLLQTFAQFDKKKCDFKVRDAEEYNAREVLDHHVHEGIPLLLKNAVLPEDLPEHSVEHVLSLHENDEIAQARKHSVEIGPSFHVLPGKKSRDTLKHMFHDSVWPEVKHMNDFENYLFHLTSNPHFANERWQTSPHVATSDAVLIAQDGASSPWLRAETGAVTLDYAVAGTRLWMLVPPGHTVTKRCSALEAKASTLFEWLQLVLTCVDKRPLMCHQEPGELLVIPDGYQYAFLVDAEGDLVAQHRHYVDGHLLISSADYLLRTWHQHLRQGSFTEVGHLLDALLVQAWEHVQRGDYIVDITARQKEEEETESDELLMKLHYVLGSLRQTYAHVRPVSPSDGTRYENRRLLGLADTDLPLQVHRINALTGGNLADTFRYSDFEQSAHSATKSFVDRYDGKVLEDLIDEGYVVRRPVDGDSENSVHDEL
ncbi:MAG: hypothetical protein MHM6MM_005630 [Cercozoa sp. M6MM]